MSELTDPEHNRDVPSRCTVNGIEHPDALDADGELAYLARLLALSDLSRCSRIRHSLRRRLLEEHPTTRELGRVAAPCWRMRLAWAAGGAAFLVTLACVAAWLGALTPVAQGFEAIVHSLSVGEHSVVHLLSPGAQASTPTALRTLAGGLRAERREGYWMVDTAIGVFTIPAVLPGRDAALERYASLSDLPVDLPFAVRVPGYVPGDRVFKEALVTPVDGVFLWYGGSAGDLVILQLPVGEQPRAATEPPIFAGFELLTDGPIEEVTIDSHTGAWVGGRVLIWESSGINHMLGGPGLSQADALLVADSME